MMPNLIQMLHASPWEGVISELGIGIETTAALLLEPGASKTVLQVRCDYAGTETPKEMRAVSIENAQRIARENFDIARNIVGDKCAFGLAITGAHYLDKTSHAWIYFASQEWEASMHVELFRDAGCKRPDVAASLKEKVLWFLEGLLLHKNWMDYLRHQPMDGVDVLYAPGVSDYERLMLLSPNNALLYHKGEFQRVTEYLRQYDVIYPGSFNPPTKAHLARNDRLYEISQQHYCKNSLSLEDLMHRIRMLNEADRPVLITQAPRFIDKYALINRYIDIQSLCFLLGADAWNLTIEESQYSDPKQLKDMLPKACFNVMVRNNMPILRNEVSKHLNWISHATNFPFVSSTEVRNSENPADHPYLTPEVAAYVRTHGLYLPSSRS